MRRNFDEFKDKEYADWRRIRLAIEHENTLVNHRITWLLTSQAFLIAAVVGVYNEAQKSQAINEQWSWFLAALIALVSTIICFATGHALAEAEIQLDKLDKWWLRNWVKDRKDWENPADRVQAITDSSERHPEIQGKRGHNVLKWKVQLWPVTFGTVVLLFQIIWLLLLVFSAWKIMLSVIFSSIQSDQRFIRSSATISDLNLLHFVGDQGPSDAAMPISSIALPGSVEDIERARIKMAKNSGIVEADRKRVELYRSLSKKNLKYRAPLAIGLSDLSLSLADKKMWNASLRAANESLRILKAIEPENPSLAVDIAAALNNVGVIYQEKGDELSSKNYLEMSKNRYVNLLKGDPIALSVQEDFLVVLENLSVLDNPQSKAVVKRRR